MESKTSELKQCNSCGLKFSKGRGLYEDWFCSENCREWYDKGQPTYYLAQRKGRWEVIAAPSDIELGSIYNNENGGIEGTQNDRRKRKPMDFVRLNEILDCLNTTGRIKNERIDGKRGSLYDYNGKGLSISIECSKRQLSAFKKKLSFMTWDDGKFYLDRMPTSDEATAIRDAIGLKRKRTVTHEMLAGLKNNRPSLLETVN